MNSINLCEETVKVAAELYERSGQVEGRDLDNWLEAERIVKTEKSTNNDNSCEETIKVAAELYERSGQAEGRELDNWLEAERIVSTGKHFGMMFMQILMQDPSSANKLMEAIKPLTELGQKQQEAHF
ncbi:MAG: DUF2934 domain-containing protein [Nitrospirota bacterium]